MGRNSVNYSNRKAYKAVSWRDRNLDASPEVSEPLNAMAALEEMDTGIDARLLEATGIDARLLAAATSEAVQGGTLVSPVPPSSSGKTHSQKHSRLSFSLQSLT